MSDGILRGTIGNDRFRFFVADTTDTTNEAFRIHQTSPAATAALGRLLTASAMMGCMLKNEDDLLTLVVKGDGPIGGITATADSRSRVKGYVHQNIVDLPLKSNGKLDVSGAVGTGTLTVLKDAGLREPFVSQVPLVSGEIAEDLTYYFAASEQTPSSVALGVLVDTDYTVRKAGGFIVQAMPESDPDVLERLEKTLKSLPYITTLLDSGLPPEAIIQKIADGLDYTIMDETPVQYYCNCNRDRVEKVLISLGAEELTSILREDKQADLACYFCGKHYLFQERQIRDLLYSLS